MNKSVFTLSCLLFLLIMACTTNPFTGSKDLNFVSNSELFPTAFQQYDQFLNENKVIKGTSQSAMVVSVGQKIKNAAEKYLNAKGYKGYLDGYAWEYNLVDDPAVNAWCMPGGKIVVYTGILPITQNEAGLATVMGHEVAHALANHGAQRMSAGTLQQLGAAGVSAATSGQSQTAQQLYQQAYGVTTQYGAMLPFSRKHENEADEIGLILMAIAGYNPDQAIAFWQRMDANSGGSAPPEFLSTHPSSNTRINNIKSLIPTAKAEAAKFGVKF
ncbi:M48 family metallopeptidase [Flavobacterium salilacus subsp. salilacus]|uniref:M48 family metallopeptidase n=1 Tax=Flavobacterium TaxID=237 RepID=UPI0010750275|nr:MULTISPECIES: M48 family metallopeptidase [Flavobacterium]KAF2517553.1 M48 family metallopeptidase [Flavobacterium salilacus subsp. salilacus]MBE1615702.1 M48 family metallopeptidase [Flavobacterium sp. SaA2.13]